MNIWDSLWFEDSDDFCSPGNCALCDDECEDSAGDEFKRLMTLEAVKASA